MSPLCVSVREVQGGAAPAPQLQKTIWRSVFSRIQLQHQLARQLTSKLVTPSEPYVHTCKQDFPFSTKDRGKGGKGLIEFGVSCTILRPKSSQIIPNHTSPSLSVYHYIHILSLSYPMKSHYIPLSLVFIGGKPWETMENHGKPRFINRWRVVFRQVAARHRTSSGTSKSVARVWGASRLRGGPAGIHVDPLWPT